MPAASPAVRRTRLDNGLRVVSEAMPGTQSVALGIWVENGSRYETRAQAGISHFLEHLFFKGTERRSAAQIAEEFDSVGGFFNAFTGKESTCYYAKVLGEHLPLAEDILADIFLHSRFDPEEIDRERSVVVQEILQGEDTPDEHVHDLFHLGYWPQHPLSFPVCGTTATVESFSRADFVDFVAQRYRPNRVVVAAAGNVEHDRLVAWAAEELGGLDGSAELPAAPPPVPAAGLRCVEKPLEQVHICIGLPGIAYAADERYAAYVLNAALGGGMSSRLFQEVREKRGRAYSIYSFLSSYLDAGYLGIYAGTSAEWAEEVMRVSLGVIRDLANDGLTAAELSRVKNQMRGNILLGLEGSDSRMNRIARNEIYFGADVSIAELSARIDAVRHDDIVDLARRLVKPDEIGATLLGNLGAARVSDDVLGAIA